MDIALLRPAICSGYMLLCEIGVGRDMRWIERPGEARASEEVRASLPPPRQYVGKAAGEPLPATIMASRLRVAIGAGDVARQCRPLWCDALGCIDRA